MIKFIRSWLDRGIIARSTISAAQWEAAYAQLPLLRGYSAAEKKALTELAILFLHRKVFEGAAGFVVTPAMTLIIALQACIPILKLGLDCYDGWISVIVYPAGFAPKREQRDEYGVVHSVQTHLSGESWQRGPVVLAWDATEHAGVIDGHNLVIHEFAHKLDMQTGSANGFPPIHPEMSSALWFETLSAGFENLQDRCRRGLATEIDCYAATAPAEFFAVLSEVFFERPDVLLHHYPAICHLFQQYYRQDPLTRLR